jgi:hypothetical protein
MLFAFTVTQGKGEQALQSAQYFFSWASAITWMTACVFTDISDSRAAKE